MLAKGLSGLGWGQPMSWWEFFTFAYWMEVAVAYCWFSDRKGQGHADQSATTRE
jgi:hypothetical protein